MVRALVLLLPTGNGHGEDGGGSRSEKMAEALVAVVKEHAQMKVGFFVCRFFRDFFFVVVQEHAQIKVFSLCFVCMLSYI